MVEIAVADEQQQHQVASFVAWTSFRTYNACAPFVGSVDFVVVMRDEFDFDSTLVLIRQLTLLLKLHHLLHHRQLD